MYKKLNILCRDNDNIGITPDQTTVYVEFYHGLLLQTILKFCVYRGLGGDYSYSNMTNYFKMTNYSKFYCKTVIVTTAIMSDKKGVTGLCCILPRKYFVV